MMRQIATYFLLLLPFLQAREVLIPRLSSSWLYYTAYDEVGGEPTDPASTDPDFYSTWYDQSIGNYHSGGGYDGPVFTGRFLPSIDSRLGTTWLVHEVNGGVSGMKNLKIDMGTLDGAALYLNGKFVVRLNLPEGALSSITQPLWDGSYSGEVEVPLPPDARLKPGANLLAVMAVSSRSANGGPRTHSPLVMSGDPVSVPGDYFTEIVVAENSLTFQWETAEARQSRIAYGLSPELLNQEVSQPEMVVSHEVVLSGLTAGKEYFYEVLDGFGASLDPPVLGSRRTHKKTLVGSGEGDWFYLQALDGGGAAVDPAGTDPNFDTTWYEQNLGGWRTDADPYNGPAFQSEGVAPLYYGASSNIGGTSLPAPVGGGRVSYYAKVIDGGASGYRDLDLELLALDGVRIYLNGKLVASKGITPFGSTSFDTLPSGYGAAYFVPAAWQTELLMEGEPYLRPGPNLLAVEVRPYGQSNNRTAFDLTLKGEDGIPLMYGLVLSGGQTGLPALEWSSGKKGNSIVRYGADPNNLTELAIDGVRFDHQITLSGIKPESHYFVEVETFEDGESLGVLKAEFDSHGLSARGPFLQKASHDRITIHWRTDVSGSTRVLWGTDPENLENSSLASGGGGLFHFVELSGLEPSTTYYYQISPDFGGLPEETYFFKTYPLPGEKPPTRIWAIGDSGRGNEDARSVYESYQNFAGDQHTDVWLMLGDNAYNYGSDASYQTAVFEMYPELLRQTAVWSTRGNHDNYAGNNYYGVFDLPTGGESGGVPSGTESYYSFDHGNIHFICLNSTNESANQLGMGGMADWLQMDLEATTAEWIIAFFHHGPYTFGSHNSDREIQHINIRQNFLGILEQYGVDLILSGHSHQYERSMLLNGHHGVSSTFSLEEHAVDSGNGSTLGTLDDEGVFVLDGGDGAYQKSLFTEQVGQVSVIAGASGGVSFWSFGSKNPVLPIRPHPVMISSLRVLGSLVLDVEGSQLTGRYLSSTGEIRDQFQIVKGGAVAVSTDTREDGTATRFKVSVGLPASRDIFINFTLTGAALSIGGFAPSNGGVIKIPQGETSAIVELIVPIGGKSALERELTLTLESVAIDNPEKVVSDIAIPAPATMTLANSPSQVWWLQNFSPALNPDWNLNDDGDGLPTLMEYAYGYDPNSFDPESEPVIYQIKPTRIEMLYVINKDRPDLQFRAVKSDDLRRESDDEVETELAGSPSEFGFEVHRAILPIQNGKKEFLQLQIIRP